jgi:hypothetical protein
MVIKVLMSANQVEESDVPDLERGQVGTTRCQTSEAHALITDVGKGKKK